MIETDGSFTNFDNLHFASNAFTVLRYQNGAISVLPKFFFQDWMGQDISSKNFGTLYIGWGSGAGVGSIVKYDGNCQSLRMGRYVAGGLRLKFLLNSQHEMGTISTCMWGSWCSGLLHPPSPQYTDTILKNDIWIGDEALFLGGSTIENGCVIGARTLVPPNFRSEPFGIYAGTPARLIRFRFSEKIRESLLSLEWWNMPVDWVKENNQDFLVNLTKIDEARSMDILSQLHEKKTQYLKQQSQNNSSSNTIFSLVTFSRT